MFNNIIQIPFFGLSFHFRCIFIPRNCSIKSLLLVVLKFAAWSASSGFPGCGGLSYVSSTIFVLYSNDLSS